MELRGGTAVVTGAGGGLGRHVAEEAATRGSSVVVVDVDAAAAEAVCDSIRRTGGSAETLAADLSDHTSVEVVVREVEAMSPLRLLVNNAGGWGTAGRQFPEATVEEWRRVLDLNLMVPMALTQGLLHRLGGGAVVNVSSSAGPAADGYACPEYAVAKAGMVRFTTSLAGLAESHDVRVSCVVPGWIGLDRAIAERARLPPEERPALVPPELIARTIVDLAEDSTSAGRVVVLDEGRPPRLL